MLTETGTTGIISLDLIPDWTGCGTYTGYERNLYHGDYPTTSDAISNTQSMSDLTATDTLNVGSDTGTFWYKIDCYESIATSSMYGRFTYNGTGTLENLSYDMPDEQTECQDLDWYWNFQTLECIQNLPECSTYTTRYECADLLYYPIPYLSTNRCQWNNASSTCSEYLPDECETASTTGNPYYCRFCETQSECESANDSCDWKQHFPDFWNGYCYNLDSLNNWVGIYDPTFDTSTVATATEEMTITDISTFFLKLAQNPKAWFLDVVIAINPFNKPPYTWVYQFADEIYTQYEMSATGTIALNPDYSTSTFGVVDFDILGTGTTTQIRIINFDWAYTGAWKNLFDKLKFWLSIALWLGAGFLIINKLKNFVNKHSQNL